MMTNLMREYYVSFEMKAGKKYVWTRWSNPMIYSNIHEHTLRIQIYRKKGISPTFLSWGWDCDHQSYSKKVFGFLGLCIDNELSREQLSKCHV